MPTTRISLGRYETDIYEDRKDGNIWQRVKVASRSGDVCMDIDLEKLAAYAGKALKAKRGTSRALNGAIVFRVLGKAVETPAQAAAE